MRVKRIIYTDGSWSDIIYDDNNNIIKWLSEDGHWQIVTYDESNNRKTFKDNYGTWAEYYKDYILSYECGTWIIEDRITNKIKQ